MSHWLDYYRLLVINSFVLTILIIHKLVRGSGAVTITCMINADRNSLLLQ
jgi:hypothetical protein